MRGNTQPIKHEPRTISSWLKERTATLSRAGVATARLDCLVLLERVLQKDRAWIAAHDDEPIDDSLIKRLDTFVAQRVARTPLAYIVGSKEFYGRDFFVTEDVLIPRPESEAMIELLLDFAASQPSPDINTIIDIGTGSGCLAITAKLALPDVHVTGIDISEAALRVAQKNARGHKAQIQWRHLNLLADGLPAMPKTRPYVVLANLPYVPNGLITSTEITKEPEIALFSGEDGLDHYRALGAALKEAYKKPFAVITESLTSQHVTLAEILADAGYQLQATNTLAQLFHAI